MLLTRKIAGEFVGTALLLAVVVGSGIMAEQLSGGNIPLALLCNTLATGAGLIALIISFGPVSGAHFNPAVTMALALAGQARWAEVPGYLLAQGLGALVGVGLANTEFGLPVYSMSGHSRSGGGQWLSEGMATFGLVTVIFLVSRRTPAAVPYAVGAYITAAYWFTASTSFANPAVTFARAFSDSFAGILLADVPAFVLAQLVGAVVATLFSGWLLESR